MENPAKQNKIIRSKNYQNLALATSRDELEDLELNRSGNSQNQLESFGEEQEANLSREESAASSEQDNNDLLSQILDEEDEVQIANRADYTEDENDDDDEQVQNISQLTRQSEDMEHRLELMQRLLRAERQENQKLSNISRSKQQQIKRLQFDHLKLQRDLVDTLELSHKLAAQKLAQIQALEQTVAEKTRLADQLTNNLDHLDEQKVRKEFNNLIEKQKELSKLELEQIQQQKEACEQQLLRERVQSSELLQQFQVKLDDQNKIHKEIEDKLKAQIEQQGEELAKVLSEPKNELIKSLREQNFELEQKIQGLELSLEENCSKQVQLTKRVESLVSEHEQLKQLSQTEIDGLRGELLISKQASQQLEADLNDKQEEAQVLHFNLQRSERRVKNLLGVLKGKESTYRELIERNSIKHEEQIEKINEKCKIMERKLMEQSVELDAKQNELVRLQLDHENQLESLRNDRDQRLAKLSNEKIKFERNVQTSEVKLARETELREQKCKKIEQLQKEADHFKGECKRLSIELTKSEAKLFSSERELSKLSNELMNKSTTGQLDGNQIDFQQQHQEQQRCLEDTRKHAKRLEDIINKLRYENEKLSTKLKINEMNLGKANDVISKEHAKMMLNYDKKLEQIKSERVEHDRNRLRYKRYGYKLKKYCEHLSLVHGHICDPENCGYLVTSPVKSNASSTDNRFAIKRVGVVRCSTPI